MYAFVNSVNTGDYYYEEVLVDQYYLNTVIDDFKDRGYAFIDRSIEISGQLKCHFRKRIPMEIAA